MPNQFEPYNKKQNSEHDFSVWEYQALKDTDDTVVVDEKEAFLAECDALRKDAVKNGYEQGMQQAMAEIAAKKKEFARWFDLLQHPVKLLDDHLTQEIIQTILWISQHCIAVELSVNPEKLRDLFNEIKKELPFLNNEHMLAMHPLDVAWVQTEIGETEIPGLQEILVADPALNRGDFYLKSEHSELDGRIYTRFATLFAKYITKDNLLLPPTQAQD